MTADVELLPLPEDVRAWLSSVRKVNNNGSAEHVELWFQSYARANVEASTKYYRDMLCQSQDDVMKLSAETEALRAEVADLRRKWSDAESNLAACDSDLWVFQQRAERLAEALRGLKDLMLERVKWEPCDCGCPQQRTPDGPHSVTWLRAAQQVEVAISKAEEKGDV